MVKKHLKPPYFRWLTQDYNGSIVWHELEPIARSVYWSPTGRFILERMLHANCNMEWADSKIDLEAIKRKEYDYEFTNGILRKIPIKETQK